MNIPIPLYALVIEQEKRVAKNKRQFWQVMLKTTAGIIKAFVWDCPSDVEINPKFPHKGDIIVVNSFEDKYEEFGNISFRTFARITKKEVPEDCKSIYEFDKASDEEIEIAFAFIRDSSFWDNKDNHAFTMDCLSRYNQDKLIACPAATHVHHNYYGGLIVHTAEVLKLCKVNIEVMFDKYNFYTRDVVYAGAILHDLGKVETYLINSMGIAEQLPTEKIIGHIYYGMRLVEDVAKEHILDKGYVNEVLHCIASHHGLVEWGSIKPVQSLEAGIVSRLDYLSSRNGMVESVLKEAKETGVLQDNFKIYGDPYFASIGMKNYVK